MLCPRCGRCGVTESGIWSHGFHPPPRIVLFSNDPPLSRIFASCTFVLHTRVIRSLVRSSDRKVSNAVKWFLSWSEFGQVQGTDLSDSSESEDVVHEISVATSSGRNATRDHSPAQVLGRSTPTGCTDCSDGRHERGRSDTGRCEVSNSRRMRSISSHVQLRRVRIQRCCTAHSGCCCCARTE